MHRTHVEYAHAGDCMLIAMYEVGSIRVVTRDQLEVVDRPTRQLWAQWRTRTGRSYGIWPN
ncbi:hypothetical protein [Paenibacillus sp. yr247]|uniref:hypothetical protein n=1 Tax=Paenibacillus sp. yr247 TaxID=1761880 RepID=UPI0015876E69|nr:hypothetical protein [Paenibacillus sp. yr247]